MNKNSTATMGIFETVLEEITQRLAAITPEKFHVPKKELTKGAHIVGTAPHDIKRLFTLHSMVTDECKELNNRLCAMADEVVRTLESPHRLTRLKELMTSTTQFEEMQQLQDELQMKSRLRQIVTEIFWLEVRRFSPELADKDSISIGNDWSLYWTDQSEERRGPMGFQVIEIGGGDLPSGLAEILAHMRR